MITDPRYSNVLAFPPGSSECSSSTLGIYSFQSRSFASAIVEVRQMTTRFRRPYATSYSTLFKTATRHSIMIGTKVQSKTAASAFKICIGYLRGQPPRQRTRGDNDAPQQRRDPTPSPDQQGADRLRAQGDHVARATTATTTTKNVRRCWDDHILGAGLLGLLRQEAGVGAGLPE
jgi:hypothetical protein